MMENKQWSRLHDRKELLEAILLEKKHEIQDIDQELIDIEIELDELCNDS